MHWYLLKKHQTFADKNCLFNALNSPLSYSIMVSLILVLKR